MSAPVDVAAAVLIRSDGAALLAQRPGDKVYSGYWEFPGGKIEPGEPVVEALKREIREELGVEIERAYPWITRVFTYPHAKVRLHFHRVYAWRGEPLALEHQALAWQRPEAITVDPLLPANGPVLRGLLLPAEYAITRAGELGVEAFLSRLDARLQGGLRLIQVREKTLGRERVEGFARRVLALARAHGAKVLVNADAALAREIGADGVHLTAEQMRSASGRPDFPWCGASCHSSEELRRAETLGADFVVLGPVRATPSHPDAVPLGWERFRGIADGASVPVYALGGINPGDMEQALSHGAHGIAMVRGSWP
ncbi:MAG: Nudix family hydrolase [Betaproteobacteria bacterium]|nr:MAG: Nudix family hydrolase [Betaproteobacteria bacterium]TMG78408.1 MAG: Nudix family hydrolase [Betaproteobacteria bacterium]